MAGESTQAQRGLTPRNNIPAQRTAIDRYISSRNDLSERQRNAVELLLRGMSDQEVAGQIGVDRGTVFRWRKNVAFARELDRQRRLLWEQSVAQLQSMVQPALTILQKQLTGDDPHNAMRAASVLLRFATPSRLLAPSATRDVKADGKRFEQDLIDYIQAPLPNEIGTPEMIEDELEPDQTGDEV